MYPPKVRTKYGLEKTPIVWLTSEASEGEQSVNSIQDLSIMIGDYLEKAEKAIVLLDGVEYLITNHGFESFLKFLQILKDRLQKRNAVLIAPVLEQALEPKELALVEREMQALTEQ
jgi:two-component system cell cycle response regulator